MAKSKDIDYYFESRRNRRFYIEYIELLRQVREYLRHEEAEQAEFRQAVLDAVTEAKIPVPAGVDLEDTVDHAIRLYRASKRGAVLPPRTIVEPSGQAVECLNWKPALKTVMNNVYTLLTNDVWKQNDVEKLATEQGWTPYRFVMTGKNKFALYASSVGDEIEDTIFPHGWVTSLGMERTSKGLRFTDSKRLLRLPVKVAQEEILHEWDAAKDALNAVIPGDIDYNHVKAILALVNDAPKQLAAFDQLENPETFLESVKYFYKKANEKANSVQSIGYAQPIAVIKKYEFNQEYMPGHPKYVKDGINHPYSYQVVSLYDDPFDLLWKQAENDPDFRSEVEEAFAKPFLHKTINLERFRQRAGKPSSLVLTPLTDFPKNFTALQTGSSEFSWHGGKSLAGPDIEQVLLSLSWKGEWERGDFIDKENKMGLSDWMRERHRTWVYTKTPPFSDIVKVLHPEAKTILARIAARFDQSSAD